MNQIKFHRPGSTVEFEGKRGVILSSIIRVTEICYEIEWEDKKISIMDDKFKIIKNKK